MEHKKWKICIEDPFPNCEYVYPIQQKYVKLLYDQAKENSNILEMVIFGSSVTDRCHMGSDVDVYLELREEIKTRLRTDFTFVMDVWNNFTVDDRLLAEIKRTGVIVFRREDEKNGDIDARDIAG